MIYALRRAGARRLLVIPPDRLALDTPPDTVEDGFDVVFASAPVNGNGQTLQAAQALLAEGGRLVVVAGRAGVATGESDLPIEQLERRCAALFKELVACEAALVESENRREAVLREIRTLQMSVSWRLTRPVRWVGRLVRRR